MCRPTKYLETTHVTLTSIIQSVTVQIPAVSGAGSWIVCAGSEFEVPGLKLKVPGLRPGWTRLKGSPEAQYSI